MQSEYCVDCSPESTYTEVKSENNFTYTILVRFVCVESNLPSSVSHQEQLLLPLVGLLVELARSEDCMRSLTALLMLTQARAFFHVAPRVGALRRQLVQHASSVREGASSLQVLVPIGTGSEEIETCCIADTLVRAGAEVTVASVEDDLTVTCSRGIKIVADVPIKDCENQLWDLVVCPGGMPGAERLRDSAPLTSIIRAQRSSGRWLGAVCAAPAVVLQHHDLLDDKATCYPAPKFTETLGGKLAPGEVVVAGNVVTSKGPGTSLPFAVKLVELLFGKEKADEIADQMLVPRP